MNKNDETDFIKLYPKYNQFEIWKGFDFEEIFAEYRH